MNQVSNNAVDIDEEAYHALWCKHSLFDREPADAAFEGGLLADRPAWVFVAGYQAAIRAVFPELEVPGWLAFAVTEDRQNPKQNPPLLAEAAEAEWLLSGNKTWVAQSRSISELLVTARLRERLEIFRVSSSVKGLSLSHRAAPRFLAAMSQGYAQFVETPAARLDDPERRRLFASAEALAMMTATAGYLQRHTAGTATAVAALTEVRQCAAALRPWLADVAACEPQRLLQLDQQFHQGFDAWQAANTTTDLPDFDTDGGLFRMYRDGIAKRASDALIRVQEVP